MFVWAVAGRRLSCVRRPVSKVNPSSCLTKSIQVLALFRAPRRQIVILITAMSAGQKKCDVQGKKQVANMVLMPAMRDEKEVTELLFSLGIPVIEIERLV